MGRQISLGMLTLVTESPPDLVRIVAEAGYTGVSLSTGLSPINIGGRPFSLLDDQALRRETARALAETGMALDLIEGLSIHAEMDLARSGDALRMMRDLGGTRVNFSVWDPDARRRSDSMARMCEVAGELGIGTTVEFMALSYVRTLDEAVELVTSGRYPGLRILPDSLHLARCGSSAEALAAIDPALIGFSQICDGPLHSPGPEAYWEEAIYDREIPGEGELPMKAFVDALPPEIILSVEVPMRRLERQGVSSVERARRALQGVRNVLAA